MTLIVHRQPQPQPRSGVLVVAALLCLWVPDALPDNGRSQSGWACKADADGKDWGCKRKGRKSGDEARPQVGQSSGEDAGAEITPGEEAIFSGMVKKLTRDPWKGCNYGTRPDFSEIADLNDPLEVEADFSEIVEQEIMSFTGNVTVEQTGRDITSDNALYDKISNTLSLQGNVFYHEADTTIASESAFLWLDTEKGRLRNPLFIIESIPARAAASVAYRDSKTLSRYEDVAYTTCRPGNQDWMLHASAMKINRDVGRISARHAWLEFKGVPFLYTPYFSMPADDRRKSGLLPLEFGYNKENGFDLTVPYYWNIAPNYDATFSPRVLSKRGLLLGGELRQLNELGESRLMVEYLPRDIIRDRARGQGSFVNTTRFSNNLTADADLNYVSDNDYLDEIGDTLSVSINSFVQSQANFRYTTPNFSFLTRAESYQVIDETDELALTAKPYRRLPQITMTYKDRLGESGGEYGFNSEFVNFQRGSRASSRRVNLQPSYSLPFRSTSAFIIPKASVQYTRYWIDDTENLVALGEPRGSPDIGVPTEEVDSQISRLTPIFSMDSGVYLERDFQWGNEYYLQTLEPRLFYVYIPNKNQDNIPLYDTTEYDFNFGQLFRENRFSGSDRIGDANQLTAAVTSKFIESQTGREQLRASLGTIFYFRDQDVRLPVNRPQDDNYSNIVAELNGLLSQRWSYRSSVQWNPNSKKIERAQGSIHFREAPNKIFNLAYRLRKIRQKNFIEDRSLTRINQIDGSFRWPLFAGWHGVGRWVYSFEQKATLESFIGVEKESCCWRFRIIGRRWVTDVDTPDPMDVAEAADGGANTGVFLQLELRGFTSFGNSLDEFLQRNISGYRIPDE